MNEYIIIAVVAALAIAFVVTRKRRGKNGNSGTPANRGMLKGGLWFHVGNMAGNFKGGNESRVPRRMIIHWLNATKNMGLNMSYMVVAGYPVKDNGQLDESQMEAIDRFIELSRERGLAVILQVGSYWGRRGNTWAAGKDQFLNWWGKDPKIENYLAQMSKRFGNRCAVFTFNEMGHSGLSDEWKKVASHYYKIIRRHSNVKIGTGEQGAVEGSEDYTLIHNQHTFGNTKGKPWIMDEPAGNDKLYTDESIRDPKRLAEYRNYFAKVKKYGAKGIVAASWINRKTPIDDAIRKVWAELAKL